jgi:hypothetical protein
MMCRHAQGACLVAQFKQVIKLWVKAHRITAVYRRLCPGL